MLFPLSVVLKAVFINFKKKVDMNSLETDKHFSRGKNKEEKKSNYLQCSSIK